MSNRVIDENPGPYSPTVKKEAPSSVPLVNKKSEKANG